MGIDLYREVLALDADTLTEAALREVLGAAPGEGPEPFDPVRDAADARLLEDVVFGWIDPNGPLREWRGPAFKPEDKYLTKQGYPLGTTCWYVFVRVAGMRYVVAADEAPEAITRAAVLTAREIAARRSR